MDRERDKAEKRRVYKWAAGCFFRVSFAERALRSCLYILGFLLLVLLLLSSDRGGQETIARVYKVRL